MTVVIFPPRLADPDLDEEELEPDDDLGLLDPDDQEPFDEDQELDALDNPEDDDLVVSEEPDAPDGRSWKFDYMKGRYSFAPSRGPLETHGDATLREWVEKCLRTPRGAFAIHSDEYGLEQPNSGIGEQAEGAFENLEERIRDALIYHPRITDIDDFELNYEEDEDDAELYALVSFTVILDDDNGLAVNIALTAEDDDTNG